MEKEIWKKIKKYNYRYLVSNKGRVKSGATPVKSIRNGKEYTRQCKERILKGSVDSKGYHQVHLSKEGNKSMELVHRLVAIEFIKNPDNKPCVNHIDFNKMNNSVDNLEWCTHKENSHHANKNGKLPRGENHFMSKLSESDIDEIFELKRQGLNGTQISRLFPVNRKTINKILIGRLWKWKKKF